MTETRRMMACPGSGLYWEVGGHPACSAQDHQHVEFGFHLHRSALALPDGTEITAVSFDPMQPYERQDPPDFGLYLDPRWQPPWEYQCLVWPDFGVPADPGLVRRALDALLNRARTRQRVEIGCLGGHGRTGTALACLSASPANAPTRP
jgi:hypothetical protein